MGVEGKLYTKDYTDLSKILGADRDDLDVLMGVDMCLPNSVSEGFEGTGFELVGWSKDTGMGATIDEDEATSGVTGAPAGWDDQCLELTIPQFDWGNVYKNITDTGLFYMSFEFIIKSRTNNSTDMFPLLWLEGVQGPAVELFGITLVDNGIGDNNYEIEMDMQYDPGQTFSYYSDAVEDTPYLVEVYFDWTDDKYEWKVDGVSQRISTLSAPPTPTKIYIGTDMNTHLESVAGTGWTVYVDNWGFNECGWIT